MNPTILRDVPLLSIVNRTRGQSLAGRVRVAATWSERLIGLLTTTRLGEDEGLWIEDCKSVHTWFMRYPIDVVFLDCKRRVIYQKTLPAWRFSTWKAKSWGVLELAQGVLAKTQTQVGDQLDWEEHGRRID